MNLCPPIRFYENLDRPTGGLYDPPVAIHQMAPYRSRANIHGDDQGVSGVHVREASLAARISGGKLYVGMEHPQERMNFVFPP
jgi:hypothetical protein